MNSPKELDNGQITAFKLETKSAVEDLCVDVETKVANQIESTNEELFN
jgi:hypothetical protein